MKAAVRTRYGPPEVVRVAEVDKPAPGARQVLVRVRATTVNRTDCGLREVEAVGPGVGAFRAGDRVFGFNATTFGAHADIQVARVGGGQEVLVYGATGAIGSAAVQLLKRVGATVTAVCDPAHLELVEGLGADRVVDGTAGDFTRDAQTYDLVFDAVGKSSFGRCRRLLKPRGTFVSSDLGPLSQNLVLPLVTLLLPGRRVRFPYPSETREVIDDLRRAIASGAFRPVLDRRYRLEEIVDAYRYVETGRKVGNVVVVVRP
jgi:NADPH:quinone reductase-like Zn-dependent oxidoreductase